MKLKIKRFKKLIITHQLEALLTLFSLLIIIISIVSVVVIILLSLLIILLTNNKKEDTDEVEIDYVVSDKIRNVSITMGEDPTTQRGVCWHTDEKSATAVQFVNVTL